METVRRVAAVADTLFPPNSIQDAQGHTRTLRASEARPERYLQHRAAWEPAFGEAVLGALRALSEASRQRHGQDFEPLSAEQRVALLEHFQKESRASFEVLHTAIATGVFADPEYGGNTERVGWYYSRFLEVG
ncbi:MAG TPA: gluconate 2-dehydrogenase subunit 3 family protein [Archangium sp.]|nr:gluconate 2-dehydrogenase subunit 3 family protein [Archangium sp.]